MIELTGIGDEKILITEWQRIAMVIDNTEHRSVYVAGDIIKVSDSYDEILEKIEEVY